MKGEQLENILLILGSPRGRASFSSQIGRRIVDDLKARYPAAKVVVRNLGKEALPHVSDSFVSGRMLSAEQRSPAEAKAMEQSDILVGELMAADVLVLATPMHNFGVSAAVKTWIDQIVRPGVTFSYSEGRPVGLVTGKKAVLALASGGAYSAGPMKGLDFQEPYLRAVLGFIGITDIETVRVEGVGLGEATVRHAVASAQARADDIVRAIASDPSTPTMAEAA
jgi:FMN-dependent NADH-azoreductase